MTVVSRVTALVIRDLVHVLVCVFFPKFVQSCECEHSETACRGLRGWAATQFCTEKSYQNAEKCSEGVKVLPVKSAASGFQGDLKVLHVQARHAI